MKALGIVGFEQTTILGMLTRAMQKFAGCDNYKITHIGVLMQIDNHHYVFEMDGRHAVFRRMETYKSRSEFIGLDFKDGVIEKFMSDDIDYSETSLIKIGFRLLTKFKRQGQEDYESQTCSGLVNRILKENEMNLGLPNMPAPAEIFDALKRGK